MLAESSTVLSAQGEKSHYHNEGRFKMAFKNKKSCKQSDKTSLSEMQNNEHGFLDIHMTVCIFIDVCDVRHSVRNV